MLGLVYLSYFAISKWAKVGDYQPAGNDQPTANPISEARFAATNIDQLLPRIETAAYRPPPLATGPRSKVRLTKDMRKQAQADYDTARGTAHLRWLRSAQAALQPQLDRTEGHIQSSKAALQNTSDRRDTELHQAVVRNLVEAELHTLPGIGSRLALTLKKQIFKGELSDLRNASLVDGIGPQKQTAINNWLTNAERQLAGLLAADFPGKQEITRRYQAERERLIREIAAAEASRQQQDTLLAVVNEEIARLSAVNAHDFEDLRADPAASADKVNRYFLGTFAPWEPMPDWFAAAIGANNTQGKDDISIRIHDQIIVNRPEGKDGLADRIIIHDR